MVNSKGTLLAVCRLHALTPDANAFGLTAIDKRPVAGPVKVTKYGLYADVQVDRKNHGGLDKALYAYAQHDAEYWQEILGYPVPPGLFGENLRIAGLDVNQALIDEQWRIGAEVLVEVTMPRTPCATFQRRLDEPQWVKRFSQAGRVGPYLRVLETGSIEAGDVVEVVHRPGHGVRIAEWFAHPTAELAQALLADPDLDVAAAFEPYFEKVFRREA